jgi:hypothetical protein
MKIFIIVSTKLTFWWSWMSVTPKESKAHETIVSSVIISIGFLVAVFVSLGLGFNSAAVGLLVVVFVNLLRVLYLETKPFRQAKNRNLSVTKNG